MLEWQPILQQGAQALASNAVKSAFSAASKAFQGKQPYAKMRFTKHFEYAFERCTKIKTIVNGDYPIDLLANYEAPDFASGASATRRIDQYSYIEKVWDVKRSVLIGFAGAGKSMFMRYLWIACSVNSRNKIPVFMELRKFNDIKLADFDAFIYASVTQDSTGDVKVLFQEAVDEGQFIFLLDGFDELKDDRRAIVEEWIIKIGYTSNILVVSSRPDSIFESWQNFSTYKMLPMTLEQTVSLINKIDFDRAVKAKFVNELKVKLFENHKTFALRPLLATMMLLTFNSYADMPEKIHVFYDQAFDTLFSRHDASKEAFKRERHTKYSIDILKRFLSFLCIITYNENETEFTESDLLERIEKAGKFYSANIEAQEFLDDLLNCVCILQKDGLNIVFSHRSFQEYFTAYCLVRLPENRVAEFVKRFSWRQSDTVLPMAFDMDRDLLVRSYLHPMLQIYAEKLAHLTEESTLAAFTQALGCGFILRYTQYSDRQNSVFFSLYPDTSDLVALRAVIFILFRSKFKITSSRSFHSSQIYHPRDDYDAFREIVIPSLKRSRGERFFALFVWKDGVSATFAGVGQPEDSSRMLPDSAYDACMQWLEKAHLRKIFWQEHQILISISKLLKASQARMTKSIDELLYIR